MKRLIPIILSIALVACGGDSATTTAAETTQPSDGGQATATTTTEAPTTTTTEPPTTTTTTPPEPSASECLVGSWNLDSENFVETLMEAMGPELPGELQTADGTYVIEMSADGTFTSIREGWGYRIVSPQGTMLVQIDGTETGTYAAEGDTLTVNVTDGEASVSMGMEVDGEIQDLPFPMEMDLPSDTVEGTGQFECTNATLTVTVAADGPNGEELNFTSVFDRS